MFVNGHASINTWTFDKAEFTALLAFADKEESRESTYGICLDAVDSSVYSSNGHIAVVCKANTTADKDAKRMTLKTSDAKILLKICPAGGRIHLTTNCTHIHAKVADRKGKIISETPHECGPDYAPVLRVIPKEAKRPDPTFWGSIGVNPSYFEPIAKMRDAAIIGACGGLTMNVTGELDPIFFTAPGEGCTWRAIIMPCRL